MPKRENLWLKVSHKLPPESVWGRIGHPVPVHDGYAFIVAGSIPSSPLARGGRVYSMFRYRKSTDTIEPVPQATYRDRKRATDALIQYRGKEKYQ